MPGPALRPPEELAGGQGVTTSAAARNIGVGALVGRLKDLSGIFAGAGAVLYALGFLMVRARSRALVGTHPEFSLIDQAYVFAGIQAVVITTIAFLITAPIVIGLYRAARR
ncbi:MAG: hypothetical protein JO122_12985, partial [Acetobacteraceae bacterium]|nr:hypothetical protein [Acetobacteraceae bacterium]